MRGGAITNDKHKNGAGMSFQKKLKCNLILAAALAAAVFGSSAANATPILPPGWSAAVFDANIDAGLNPITNIAIFVRSTTSPLGIGRFSTAHSGFNEFYAGIPPAGGLPVSAFAAGVIAGLPGDPAGAALNHLVIFGKFTPAQLSLDYATLFPGIAESTLINDLLTVPASSPFPFADANTFTQEAFADGLYGGDGSSFTVAAFSTGTVIGSGTISFLPKAAVPEPMTITLFGTALAGLAVVRRRKKRA